MHLDKKFACLAQCASLACKVNSELASLRTGVKLRHISLIFDFLSLISDFCSLICRVFALIVSAQTTAKSLIY